MKIRVPNKSAVFFLIVVFILPLGVAFLNNPYYPVLIIVGENSAGTWMSVLLLAFAAAFAMIIGLQRKWFPWFGFSSFFLLLAADERFMFHESIKERLVFSGGEWIRSYPWLTELPVIAGSVAGLLLWVYLLRKLNPSGRIFLSIAVFFGSVSVTMDVLKAGAFIEDLSKLTGELFLCFSLIGEVDIKKNR